MSSVIREECKLISRLIMSPAAFFGKIVNICRAAENLRDESFHKQFEWNSILTPLLPVFSLVFR